MVTDTASPITTGTNGNLNGNGHGASTVSRVAQKAHETVDKLEQTLGDSTEKVMGLQHEYTEMAREHVKANPLVALGVAFGAGILFSKLFMR